MASQYQIMSRQYGGTNKMEFLPSAPGKDSVIDIPSSFKVIDLLFKQPNIMYAHQHNSFDKFINKDVHDFIQQGNNTFYTKVDKKKVYRYFLKIENSGIESPTLKNNEPMFPNDARIRNISYSGKLMAKITQYQEITDITTGESTIKDFGYTDNIAIGVIPIMVRSKNCNLNQFPGKDTQECRYDPGGYFIVNGSEKVVIPIERRVENKPIVFVTKDSSNKIHNVQINSRSYKPNGLSQMITVKMKNEVMTLLVPIFNEVNVCIVLRALGFESDKDIINYVVYDTNDTDMVNLVKKTLDACRTKSGEKIITQEKAMLYLINEIRVMSKKYSDIDEDIKQQQQLMHLKELLTNSFLPHVNGSFMDKAHYMGYSINKLLNVYLGRSDIDDKDSYINKRIDLAGTLLFELFRQHFKKLLNDCNKYFRKRNMSDTEPISVLGQIKPNNIEQGLKTALLTGAWGKKKGVAQMLLRTSTMVTYSSLRRINFLTSDASTKLIGPRHLHPSQCSMICPVETPEGIKVGIVKHLSISTGVTIMHENQVHKIKMELDKLKKIKRVTDVPSYTITQYIKVFLNGEWLGLTKDADYIVDTLKAKKLNGSLVKTISVSFDRREREVRIYCDGGRLYRPLFRVENNTLVLKKSNIDKISLHGMKTAGKISTWKQLMTAYPTALEYVDVDEMFQSMVAMYPSTVEKMRQKMISSYEIIKKFDKQSNYANITNRYGDTTFVRYTHCELHPSMMLGVVASNIPFLNHNQGPRNMFQFSQARHSMGVYASNWRNRLDISYVLYHTQRPIVITKGATYTNGAFLPAGENAIVAIMCYTGYNQEDSVIVNRGSIDRGFFRSISVKKAMSIIQKNQSTGKDDIFMRPDPTTVIGIRPGSYEKLNEKGYVKEETTVRDRDIIIGKVSPIQQIGNTGKIYKDSSEIYKGHVPATIDKVYLGMKNHDGKEVRKVRIRIEKKPIIGDKVCSRSGQKGTIGNILPREDMPYTENGIIPDIIMNPNAIPSRMTVAQLIECVISKSAALKGEIMDGTPFNTLDVDSVKKQLKDLGYHPGGYETMYNGMTGRKLRVQIFIGPTYYQRLKHMVSDKAHSRAHGPLTMLTRQPTEGRAREGGLRFGEMERDAIIAHGMSVFLNERFLHTSDVYVTRVCDICGLFATRMKRKDYSPYGSRDDIYHCPACSNQTEISKIVIPYAFKLLVQELLTLNIATRIRVKKNIYNSN